MVQDNVLLVAWQDNHPVLNFITACDVRAEIDDSVSKKESVSVR